MDETDSEPIIPPANPKEKGENIGVRLPKRMWRQLQAIAKEEKRSRNKIVELLLTWAIKKHLAQRAAEKKGTANDPGAGQAKQPKSRRG